MPISRIYQYPYAVHKIELNIQGEALQMAYMDVAPAAANGHVVMLLHGKNFNAAYWGETAKVLAENGYRAIIPDQIGFGKSSEPKHIQYTFQLLCENCILTNDLFKLQNIPSCGPMPPFKLVIDETKKIKNCFLLNVLTQKSNVLFY